MNNRFLESFCNIVTKNLIKDVSVLLSLLKIKIMKHYIFCLIICLNVLVVKAQTAPNVILIMTDDQGYGDITSHGNLKIKTPNMDKITSSGARLDNFYVSSVCAPTRVSLLTGRYHIRTGVTSVTNNLEEMCSNEVAIAEVYKGNSFTTGLFGKWHMALIIQITAMVRGLMSF